MRFFRTILPIIFCFVTGAFACLLSFIPHPAVQEPTNMLNDWAIVITTFSVVLAVQSFVSRHTKSIASRKPGWGYSAVTMVTLTGAAFIGIFWGKGPGTPMGWVYEHMITPLSSTVYCLSVFFIASAAYKAFRVRSSGATLLLITGLIVMLGQIPFGAMISGGFIPLVKDWILEVPNMSAQRGILLGLALAMFATSLKILLGIERTYLGKGD